METNGSMKHHDRSQTLLDLVPHGTVWGSKGKCRFTSESQSPSPSPSKIFSEITTGQESDGTKIEPFHFLTDEVYYESWIFLVKFNLKIVSK